MGLLKANTEFRRFIETLGPWFEGMAKFVAIMARHNDDIYTGERLMLQKLERETFKIDKYLKELRCRYKNSIVAESVLKIQEKLLAHNWVGKALAMPTHEMWQLVVDPDEMSDLDNLLGVNTLMDQCIYEPFRKLFGLKGSAHRLNSLNDESMASRLFVAAVNDGSVSVIVGESVTPIVMDGITARMIDAFSLAELVDTEVSFTVDIGGFQIEFGASHGQ